MVDRHQTSFEFGLSDANPATLSVEIGYRSCEGHAVTASSVWDSAVLLARYLEQDPDPRDDPGGGRALVGGRRVLELGSGTGFGGLVAAALGASSVLLTDLAEAVPLLDRNVERFVCARSDVGVPVRVTAMALPWGPTAADEVAAANHGLFDLVLCADCLLPGSTNLFPLLVDTLASLTATQTNPDVLFAFEERMDCSGFFELLEAANISWTHVPSDALHPDFRASQIRVLRMQRGRASVYQARCVQLQN